MLPVSSLDDDEEMAAELERYRADLGEESNIYRNDSIGHMVPGSLAMPQEQYSASRRYRSSDDDRSGNESEEDDTDNNDNTSSHTADKISSAARKVQQGNSANTDVADAASASIASTNRQTVLHLKLQDESVYASDGVCQEFEEESGPASECSSENSEGDVRHVFEHVSSFVEEDQNRSVSQCIKRIYLNQKWLRHQARLARDENHLKRPALPRSRVASLQKRAFLDEWEVEEHIMVPEDYRHISRLSSDLQHIGLDSRISIDDGCSLHDQDVLYQHDPIQRDSEAEPITHTSRHFRFKPHSINTRHRASTPHFQLRNHFAVQDHLRYIYSSGTQVWSEYNWSSTRINLMDFGNATPHAFANPVTISTLALSNDHLRSICMIGGLSGEFAYKSLLGCTDVLKASPITTGHITTAPSAVTNHIEISSHPRHENHAIISSNDSRIRTLDLTTGHFLHSRSAPSRTGTLTGHSYPFPINCTANCPDGRLRVAIGDHHNPLIIRSDTGTIERELPGHSDHGFACAWSPDARYVATAAQDRIVNIYDTRMWRVCSRFVSYGSTCRSMRFSSLGGGSSCLLLAEETDRVSVVDMVHWERVQTMDFLGGVVGVDFEKDGGAFWIANCDARFGGFMRWDVGESGAGTASRRVEFCEDEDGRGRGDVRSSKARRSVLRRY